VLRDARLTAPGSTQVFLVVAIVVREKASRHGRPEAGARTLPDAFAASAASATERRAVRSTTFVVSVEG